MQLGQSWIARAIAMTGRDGQTRAAPATMPPMPSTVLTFAQKGLEMEMRTAGLGDGRMADRFTPPASRLVPAPPADLPKAVSTCGHQ